MGRSLGHIFYSVQMFFGSIVAWLSFALGIIFYLLPIAFFSRCLKRDREEQRRIILHHIRRIILLPLDIAPNVSYRIENQANETFEKQAIIICNHQSFFDILLCLSLSDKLTILVKSDYRKSFFIRTMVKIADYHFVKDDPFELYKEVERDIRRGYSLVVFPEGTRSENGRLGHFSHGAFTLARFFDLDILPLVERGLEHILPKGRLIADGGKVTLSVLPRFSQKPHELGGLSIKKQVRLFENYYRNLFSRRSSVCVLGGGMGGLFTGAILSKIGFEVTVVEKNHIIGGGLQSFKRGEAVFNTGMHNFGGFGQEWLLSHLLQFLGIKDRLDVMPTCEQVQDIIWTDTEHCYRLPRGRCNFEAYLASIFPNQKDGLHAYLDDTYTIANAFDHFKMRPSMPHPEAIFFGNLSVKDLLYRHLSDEELIRVLSYLAPLCGNSIAAIPVSVYSMLMTLYLDGEYRFVDSAWQLTQELAFTIQQNGGMVLNDTTINHIHVEDGHVTHVESEDGRQWVADKYVVAFSPKNLVRLASNAVMRKVSINRIENFVPSCSAFSIYIQLKKRSFPFINSTIFVPVMEEDAALPGYILITTPPTMNQDEWANTVEILVPSRYSLFAQWSASRPMQRGPEYENFKECLANQIIDYLKPYYDIRPAIERFYTASPLTIKDFYGNPDGAMFAQQGLYMPVKTRADNLFLTGQSVLFHGLCGVPITAIITAEAITNADLLSQIKNISQ